MHWKADVSALSLRRGAESITLAADRAGPLPGSSGVNVCVEFGEEEMTTCVIVPTRATDEEKNVLAIGRTKSLAREFGNLA